MASKIKIFYFFISLKYNLFYFYKEISFILIIQKFFKFIMEVRQIQIFLIVIFL